MSVDVSSTDVKCWLAIIDKVCCCRDNVVEIKSVMALFYMAGIYSYSLQKLWTRWWIYGIISHDKRTVYTCQ